MQFRDKKVCDVLALHVGFLKSWLFAIEPLCWPLAERTNVVISTDPKNYGELISVTAIFWHHAHHSYSNCLHFCLERMSSSTGLNVLQGLEVEALLNLFRRRAAFQFGLAYSFFEPCTYVALLSNACVVFRVLVGDL
jgi:hypothetical protein